MIVLYVILGIVIYFIIGAVISGLMLRYDDDWKGEKDSWNVLIGVTVAYPILVPFALVGITCEWIIRKIGRMPK